MTDAPEAPRDPRDPAAAASEPDREPAAEESQEESGGFPYPGFPRRAPLPARLRILAEGRPEACRVAIFEDGKLVEYLPSPEEGKPTRVGDIYLGRVTKLAPGVEAAFVDIGLSTDAFLPESEWAGEDVRPGAHVLVQIQKDAIGDKGARVGCNLALAGRNLVLLPGDGRVRISRRIPPGPERERLFRMGGEVLPEGYGFILRTVSTDLTREDLQSEIEGLTLLDKQIRAKARALKPPNRVHREPGAAARVVRDHLTEEAEAVLVGNAELASEIRSAAFSAPDELLGRIRVEEGAFERAGVERELARALKPRVSLKSGGHVVIEATEALVSIDVNSGGSKGGRDLEATALATNLEACEVISRHLRLRDLGGILVIDFIDLTEEAHRNQVQEKLEICLARDRGNPRVHGWTDLGLMLLSRRRRRLPLHRMLQRPCPTCRATGRVDAPGRLIDKVASAIRVWLEKNPGKQATLLLAPDLIPRARKDLELDPRRVEIKGDKGLAEHEYRIQAR